MHHRQYPLDVFTTVFKTDNHWTAVQCGPSSRILPFMPRSPKRLPPFKFPDYTVPSRVRHMPTHFILPHFISDNTRRTAHMQLPQSSCPNTFLRSLSLHSSLKLRDQVTDPHKTRGKMKASQLNASNCSSNKCYPNSLWLFFCEFFYSFYYFKTLDLCHGFQWLVGYLQVTIVPYSLVTGQCTECGRNPVRAPHCLVLQLGW
jgi:hypothetical protein